MFLRAMSSGYEPGDLAVQTGMISRRGTLKRLKDQALGIRYLPTVDLTDRVLDQFMRKMAKDRIGYLMGYAQSLEIFARRAIHTGFDFELKGTVSWGSILLPEHRVLVRRAFNCKVYDSYGVSEGMQIAAQCGHSENDFHQFCLHVAIEFCRDGSPVPRGETGDILLTRLNPGAMPFIRYAVGDMGQFSMSRDCPCGRSLPLIVPIMGRTSDIIKTPNGNRLVIHFFSSTLGKVNGLLNYQAIQKSEDHLHIQFIADQSLDQVAWQYALETIRNSGGDRFRVTHEQVPSIPLAPSGKRQYIRSDVGR